MPVGTTPQAWNTTYELEKWYPPYYFEDRPGPQGMPDQINYGGSTFNITMDASYMGSSANYKANHTKFMIIRPGFSTHAMNMGQRSLVSALGERRRMIENRTQSDHSSFSFLFLLSSQQLDHTYTVNEDGTVDYMVNPMPINTNLVVPGPALFFVTINGVPSIGKFVQIGDMLNKNVPAQVTVGSAPSQLPAAINNPKYNDNPNESALQNFGIGKLVAIIAAAVVVIIVIVVGLLCWRKRANKDGKPIGGGDSTGLMGAAGGAGGAVGWASRGDGNGEYKRVNTPTSSIHNFAPGNPANQSTASFGTWDSYRMQDVGGTPNGGAYDSSPSSPHIGSGASLAAAGAGAGVGLAAGATAASRGRSPLTLKPATHEDDNFGGGSSYAGSNYGDSQRQQYQDNSYGNQDNSYGNQDNSYGSHSNSGYDQSQSYSNQQQQGWGEHQAGDAGEYYQDNTDRYQGHQTAADASTGYAAGAYYDEPSSNNNDYNQNQNYNYSQNQAYNDPYSNDQYGSYGSGGGNYNSGNGGGNYSSGNGGGSYSNSGNSRGNYNSSSGGGNYSYGNGGGGSYGGNYGGNYGSGGGGSYSR